MYVTHSQDIFFTAMLIAEQRRQHSFSDISEGRLGDIPAMVCFFHRLCSGTWFKLAVA